MYCPDHATHVDKPRKPQVRHDLCAGLSVAVVGGMGGTERLALNSFRDFGWSGPCESPFPLILPDTGLPRLARVSRWLAACLLKPI